MTVHRDCDPRNFATSRTSTEEIQRIGQREVEVLVAPLIGLENLPRGHRHTKNLVIRGNVPGVNR